MFGNCIPAMKNRQKNPAETTGNKYKTEILMSRTRKLKGLAAASFRLKTLNDKSLIKRLIKTYCIVVFISMFNLNSNKTK